MEAFRKLMLVFVGVLGIVQTSWAHAFLDHAEPAVGSTVHASPAVLKVWFTEKQEQALCKLQVFDESGREVATRKPAGGGGNTALLTVSLPPLKPGKYKVAWRVVSVDTHVTSGDFEFEISP